MRTLAAVALAVLCSASFVSAQATPSSRLGWDQDGPDLATVQGYTYRYYSADGTSGTLSDVRCEAAGAAFSCTAAFPAFTPMKHSIAMTAVSGAEESARSAPLEFVFVVLSPPRNLRIVQ